MNNQDVLSTLRTSFEAQRLDRPVGDVMTRGRSIRRRRRGFTTGISALVAVGVALALLAISPFTGGGSLSKSAGPKVSLAGFTIALPAGAHLITASTPAPASCEPNPPPTPGVPETAAQAGGQFIAVKGGCLHINLGSPSIPNNAQPVTIGTYYGYLVDDEPASTITLYVNVFTDRNVIFTASGTTMSNQQLVAMAQAGMPPCSPDREDQAPCYDGGP